MELLQLLYNSLIIVGFTIRHCSCNVNLIKDFIKTNYLTTILIISCDNELTSMETKSIDFNGRIWFNVLDISDGLMLEDFNYNKFFDRYSHPHGVVVNFECNQTNSFLMQMSQRYLFHNERFWLMFTANLEKTFTILSQQNINVDAEIIIALPIDHFEENYDIYEAFNPSSVRGGHLNITALGNWNRKDGLNIPVRQTKIERRRDLQGITLLSVTSVT